MAQLRLHHNADAITTDRQHVGPITGLAIVGDKLLSAGHDQRILGFEPLPRGPLYFSGPELRSASAFVDMQAVKVDHRMVVAAACEDRDIRLWDVSTLANGGRAVPRKLSGHTGEVNSVDVQQTFLLSASQDTTARVWDIQTDCEVVAVGHPDAVGHALFFPSSTIMSTTCVDGVTRIWDLRASTQKPTCVIQDLGECNDFGGSATISGRNLLATAGKEGQVHIYDVPRCGARRVLEFEVPSGVNALQFVLDDRYILCAGDGDLYTVRLEDLMAQAFVVQQEPKRAITVLRSSTYRNQALLAYAFASHGWGLGVLDEVEPE